MASILQRIVTLLGDAAQYNNYQLNGSDVIRQGQKIATYSIRTESNREIVEVVTVNGTRLSSSSVITENVNQRTLLHD